MSQMAIGDLVVVRRGPRSYPGKVTEVNGNDYRVRWNNFAGYRDATGWYPKSRIRKVRHLRNIYDYRMDDAPTASRFAYSRDDLSQDQIYDEWVTHLRWVEANVVWLPKAADNQTVDQLRATNTIGIWGPVEENTNER